MVNWVDIVYSSLIEKKFQEIHGDGWVNLSVENNISKTEICTRFNICSIPNGAGKFMRISGGDSAEIGVIQDYSTALPKKEFFSGRTKNGGEHSHTLKGSFFQAETGASTPMGPVAHWMWKTGPRETWQAGDHFHHFIVTAGGDSETRPVNIAYYAYMKVNTGRKGSIQEENIKSMDKELKSLGRKVCPIQTSNLSSRVVEETFACHKSLIEGYEGLSGTSYRMNEQELRNSLFVLRALLEHYSLSRASEEFIVRVEKKYPLF